MHFPASLQSAFSDESVSSPGTLFVTFLLAIYALQQLAVYFHFPILSVPEILWNAVVYIMPSRLVYAIAPNAAVNAEVGSSNHHAAKSQILRSVLRIDKNLPLRRHLAPEAPSGLGNWDNSCYQNSILQALASLRPFQSFLQNTTASEDQFQTSSTAETLLKLIVDLNSKSNRGKHLWTPAKLKSMSSWQQQDAQEYFSKLVEQIEKDTSLELNSRDTERNVLPLKSLFVSGANPKQEETIENAIVGSQSKKDKVSVQHTFPEIPNLHANPMEGLLAQRVGCIQCGYSEGLSLIPFNCLTLPLGKSSSYMIEDCLDEYTKLEPIEGVECAKCTLLQHQHQLQKLLETASSCNENSSAEGSSTLVGFEEKDHFPCSLETRLDLISEALQDEDFSETTLAQKCQIPSRLRTSTTKSRQAVIMRPPQCLVVHVNRSVFDEFSGAQLKNYANVNYDEFLDIKPWCAGQISTPSSGDQDGTEETWEMKPSRSMLAKSDKASSTSPVMYRLRAVITHHGRHENGHYVCFKNVSTANYIEPNEHAKAINQESRWWRLSDESVYEVDQDFALEQEGAFMLFYERMKDDDTAQIITSPSSASRYATDHASESKVEVSDPPTGHDSEISFVDAQELLSPEIESEVSDSKDPVDLADSSSMNNVEENLSYLQHSVTTEATKSGGRKQMAPSMKTGGPNYRFDDEPAFPQLHMVATT